MKNINQKHIDVIVKYFYPIAGGIENNIMQTYTVLHNTFGWDITIHTSANTYTEKNILPRDEVINTLHVKRYPAGIFGFKADIDWKTTSVVALHNFDIFFVRYLFLAWLLKLFGKKTFAMFVTPHGGFNPEWSMFSLPARLLKKFYTYVIGAWFVNHVVDGMRAVSGWERDEEIKHIIPSKVEMIDNGLEDEAYVDIDTLASEQTKKDVAGYGKYIIQIGRVYPIKNFETSISCLQYLPTDIKLVIIGQLQDPEYRTLLYKLVDDLGLKDRVIFAGVKRGVDKYYVIRHAIAMVHMALWESGCNVVREGMSQGLPCIVSNVYGLPGLVTNNVNGFCLPVRDITAVSEKVRWIINPKNIEAVTQIRNANIIFGKGQSWKEVARKMNNFYLAKLKQI